MDILELFIFLFLIIQNLIVTDVTSSKNPGISACYYYNNFDLICNLPTVPVNYFPKECTSFFFDGLNADKYGCIKNTNGKFGENELKDLSKCGKTVYLDFGYQTFQEWFTVVNCDDTMKKHVQLLKKYLQEYQITGLLLKNINMVIGTDPPKGFSEKLKIYIQTVKECIQNIQIGLMLSATNIIASNDDKSSVWLDFELLNCIVDFYVVGFGGFNVCNQMEFSNGIIPLDGNSTFFTLENLGCALETTNIPKDKLYFLYSLVPKASPASKYIFTPCLVKFHELCSVPDKTTFWCADNSYTLRKKGSFSNQYGAGFVAANLKSNDPNGVCQCGFPYPSFHFLLSGWNNEEPKLTCPLFDRNKKC